MKKIQVIVIGAGTGGIMSAAQLKKADPNLQIAIIEPSDKHYYQPAWTLVGANTYDYDKTVRETRSVIPQGVEWIRAAVESLDPENNTVSCSNGESYQYEYLIVAPGIKMDCSLVDGLSESIDKGVVCSNYTKPQHTWEVLKNFRGGTALFTQPNTPIKCGGAPQKIMYLADDHFRRSGVRDKTRIVFATPGTTIFGVPEIRDTLLKVVERKDIHLLFGYNLAGIDATNNIAWYELADHANEFNSEEVEIVKETSRVGIKYDMIHLAPPQTAPDFLRNSTLAGPAGWMAVDKNSMQSTRYANVFGIGDATDVPTAKTGAAIRKQVPVMIANLLQVMTDGNLTSKKYNGYSSCPLVTGYGKMVLAEFDYDNKFTPDPKLKQMGIFDSSKEHWRLWILKKYILPYLYWNKMMKGEQV